MKLREKITELLSKRIFNHEECVEKIETICNEFADEQSIGFSVWIAEMFAEDYLEHIIDDEFDFKREILTAAELLTIYKSQK